MEKKGLTNLMERLNKKTIIIGLSVLVGIIVLVIVIVVLSNRTTTLTCTRDYKVSDFKFKEELIIEMEKSDKKENKGKDYYEIIELNINKSVTIGDKLNKFPNYDSILLDKFKKAYGYLPKGSYKVEQKDHVTKVKATLKDKDTGLILDNINIIENSKDNPYDLTFNHVEELESSKTSYKIGDDYTKKTILVKLEGLGYTCK